MRILENAYDAQIQQIFSDFISKNQFFPRSDSISSLARDQSVQTNIQDKSKTEITYDSKLLVYSSGVPLDNSFKREIMDTLTKYDFYGEIVNELESRERKEVVKRNETYRKKNELLIVHLQN